MAAAPTYSPSLATRLPIVSKTAAYAVTNADYTVLADAVGGAFDVTLPSAVGIEGAIFVVKRLNAGVNAVTVKATAGTLDGAAAATGVSLGSQFVARAFQSDGTNWHVVGAHL